MIEDCFELRKHVAAAPERAVPGRVLLITPGGLGERGGIGRLINHIVGRCAHRPGAPEFTIIDPYGPRNLAVAPFFFLRALLDVVGQVARGRAQLAHVNMASWGSVIRKGVLVHLLAVLRVPIVLHLHAGDFEAFYGALAPFGQRFVRGLFRRADRLIVLGDQWRCFLRDVAGVAERRVIVLENAVAGPEVLPARPAGGPCRLLFLGRIEAEKGMAELLTALADPRLAGLEWRATLAGAGDIATFRQRADRLGLGARVDFVGWQDEPAARALLAESDIFVLPSHFEGLSMAILEAMAFGLAIVCTPVGSLPVAVEDGISGLFVPVGDAGALAGALLRVIAEPQIRHGLQEQARLRFNRKFDIDVYCSVLERTYREVLSERSGAARELSARH